MEQQKADSETMVRILKRLIDGFDIQARTSTPGFQWTKKQYEKMPVEEKNQLKRDLRFMMEQQLIERVKAREDMPPSFRVTDKGQEFIQSILKGAF